MTQDIKPWTPGYRFSVLQEASKRTGCQARRKFQVVFVIDQDGEVRWAGGVKANQQTWNSVLLHYLRNKP